MGKGDEAESVQAECFCRWRCGGCSGNCSCRRTSFLTLSTGSLQKSRTAAKKCMTRSCVCALIKPSDCLTCGNQRTNTNSSVQGQRTEKEPWNTEPCHRWRFLQEYIKFCLSKFRAFYLYVIYHDHLFCVSRGQILIARFHKVMVGFTRVSFTFEVGEILKTLQGFFLCLFCWLFLIKDSFTKMPVTLMAQWGSRENIH